MKLPFIYFCSILHPDVGISQLKKSFGASNEFIKSVSGDYKPNVWGHGEVSDALQKEIQLVASCTYCDDSEWGIEASNF